MSLPIVLCGQTTGIASVVIAGLKPQYEVIHLCLSKEAAVEEIPHLLAGKSAPSENELGSKNYSQPPRAVVIGGAFDEIALNIMRKACEEIKQVPWFRPTPPAKRPSLGTEQERADYGKAMVLRLKERLAKAQQSGELNTGEIFLY